jgi:hypothetical protein
MGLTLALHTRILRVGELSGWFAERKVALYPSDTRQNLRKAII